MKVGINGMGRMGRLALRAAMGGVHRPDDDPRRDNRLDIVHVNEIKGGGAVAAHLVEFDSVHGRWHTSFEVDGDKGFAVGGKYLGFSAEAHATSLSWIIYNDLRGQGTPLFGSAATTSVLTIIGVAILMSPVLRRTWRDHKAKA